MSDNNVEVKFGAETSGVETGAKNAAKSITDALGQMNRGFESLHKSVGEHTAAITSAADNMSGGIKSALSVASESFELLTAPIQAVAGLLIGGKIFKESISAVSDEVAAVKQLVNIFGLTYDAASSLNVSLDLVGISAEEFTGIALKFDRQLKTNEEGLNKLGVTTRDTNGDLLSQTQLLKNAVDTMLTYKTGIDRNEFAMANFGRSADDAFKLLKLNESVLQKGAELHDKYGFGVDEGSAAALKNFKIATAEAGIVSEEFGQSVG
jgi:hypothetical protein